MTWKTRPQRVTFLIMLLASLALPRPVSAEDAPILHRIEGISFASDRNLDLLKIGLPEGVAPDIHRYGVPNRVVISFPHSILGGTLLSLVQQKRGNCVERFEVQTIREVSTEAGTGDKRPKESPHGTNLIAYLESDVEVEYTIKEDRTLELSFRRNVDDPAQNRPVPPPPNTLRHVTFDGDLVNHMKVTFHFTDPVWPRIQEETCRPRRLILYFPQGLGTITADNEFRAVKGRVLISKMNLFDIGSRPTPYPQMSQGRDYHFFGYPSPLASNPYFEQIFGFQQQGTVAHFNLDPDVAYQLDDPGKTTYKVVFDRLPEPEYACIGPPPPMYIPPPIADPCEVETGDNTPPCYCPNAKSTAAFPMGNEVPGNPFAN